jgi:HEAT repeat protein
VTKKSSKPLAFIDAVAMMSAGHQALDESALRAFSDLSGEKLETWTHAWQQLAGERRIAIMEQMRDFAEEDFEQDFNAVYRAGLFDVEERVRLAALDGLFEDEHHSLIKPLMTLLKDDPSEAVRAAAAQSLGRFVLLGEKDGMTAPRKEQVYTALMRALLIEPAGSIVHRRALESVAYVSNDEIDLRIRDAFNSEDDLLRLSAIVAMGHSSNRAYVELVRSELRSLSPAVRREAARAAGSLEDGEAVTDLAQLLDDPDESVKLVTLDALAEIGGKDARRLLEAAMASEDEEFAAHAEKALEELDFWHGEIDFSLALFDENEQKPTHIITPKPQKDDAKED